MRSAQRKRAHRHVEQRKRRVRVPQREDRPSQRAPRRGRSTGSRLPPTEQLHPRARTLDTLSPTALVRAIASEEQRAVAAVLGAAKSLGPLSAQLAQTWAKGGTLYYVGAGTSGRLGALDAAEIPPTFGIPERQARALLAGGPRAMRHAIEGAEDNTQAGARAISQARVRPRDLVIGIAASGNTPFVMAALKRAAELGVRTALVACAPPREGNAPKSTHLVLLRTGPELVSGSTRLTAGTATKLALNALTTSAAVQLHRVHEGRMVALRPTNEKLRKRALRMTVELTKLDEKAASGLLAKAGGIPAIAIAMHRAGVSASAARQALKAGRIGLLLGAKQRNLAR
ncbi:MAG: N-acetylmuramic acid 6-phosphate etherase [Myxococcaceae bacterium]